MHDEVWYNNPFPRDGLKVTLSDVLEHDVTQSSGPRNSQSTRRSIDLDDWSLPAVQAAQNRRELEFGNAKNMDQEAQVKKYGAGLERAAWFLVIFGMLSESKNI
jgi:hypothetical protein